MSFLSWLADHSREPDNVTADTRAWLDHESRGEQEARAELLAEHVRHGATKADLRTFQRKYGAASAVIGQLRAELARERERARGHDTSISVQHGDPVEASRAVSLALRLSRDPITPLSKHLAADTALAAEREARAEQPGSPRDSVIDAVIHDETCTGGAACPCEMSYLAEALRVASWEQPRSDCWPRVARLAVRIVRDLRIGEAPSDPVTDAAVVDTAERLGNEIQPDQTVAHALDSCAPLPWRAQGPKVIDADDEHVFIVDSLALPAAVDERIADLLVQLVNAHLPAEKADPS